MQSCTKDSECREDYVCDYSVCRPRCTNADRCQNKDICIGGHCKAGCKLDSECNPGERCQDSKCLPPCKKDSDCLPGNKCDTGSGKCQALPGKKMGETCTNDAECSTRYCLPVAKVCSVRCTNANRCPSQYGCGLQMLDKDGNGAADGAESACVPSPGSAIVGATCEKDSDCRGGHCYLGFCMEGCKVDDDCGLSNQCSAIKLVTTGAIVDYAGCLPKQGTSKYVIGKVSGQALKGLYIPKGASSFVLSTQVDATDKYAMVTEFKDPTGKVLTEVADKCKSWSYPIRYNPDMQIASLMMPNNPSVKLTPGLYVYSVAASDYSSEVTVTIQLKMGKATKGTLDLNWTFLDLAGTCIPGATLNAASAEKHPWFTKFRADLRSILGTTKLTVGKETFGDLKDASLNVIDLETYKTLGKLFSTSKGKKNRAVNIFLVRNITSKGGFQGGTVLGIAGGIPGPPAIHGTTHSGVAMSMQTACFEKYGYNPAHTMAHELGHFLGLSHNMEQITYPGVAADGKSIDCPCPCGANMTCYVSPTPYGGKWCRGMDNIADTSDSSDNLMFYAAESTQMFKGNKLSAGQVEVVLSNPLVGF